LRRLIARLGMVLLMVVGGAVVAVSPAHARVLGSNCVSKIHNPREWVKVCVAHETGLYHSVRGVASMKATSSAVHVQIEWLQLYTWEGDRSDAIVSCFNCPRNGQTGSISASTEWLYGCFRDDVFSAGGAATIRWSDGQLSQVFLFGDYHTYGGPDCG
jgi:hypothetical protein